MKHSATITLTLLAATILAGCTTSYRETLDQKLADKNANERRTVLAQECGQEIQKGLKPEEPANVRHFEKMKQICEEMTGKKVNAALPTAKRP